MERGLIPHFMLTEQCPNMDLKDLKQGSAGVAPFVSNPKKAVIISASG